MYAPKIRKGNAENPGKKRSSKSDQLACLLCMGSPLPMLVSIKRKGSSLYQVRDRKCT